MPTLGRLFLLAWSLRCELFESLNSVRIGQSFYCFEGERNARDNPLCLCQEPSDLARRMLPFFEIFGGYNYACGYPRNRQLQRLSLHDCNLGEIGVSSVLFALRRLDVDYDQTIISRIRSKLE